MADYDAQPGREPPEQPELSAAQREADEVDLYVGLRGVAGIVAGAREVIELLGEARERTEPPPFTSWSKFTSGDANRPH